MSGDCFVFPSKVKTSRRQFTTILKNHFVSVGGFHSLRLKRSSNRIWLKNSSEIQGKFSHWCRVFKKMFEEVLFQNWLSKDSFSCFQNWQNRYWSKVVGPVINVKLQIKYNCLWGRIRMLCVCIYKFFHDQPTVAVAGDENFDYLS